MALPVRKNRPLLLGAIAGFLAALVAIGLARTGWWSSAEDRAQALLLLRAARPVNPQVVVLGIDDAAYQAFSPFRRKQLARIIEAVHAAGAKAVGLDLWFVTTAVDGAEGDAALGRALREAGAAQAVPCATEEPADPAALRAKLAPLALPEGPAPALACPGVLLPSASLLEGASLVEVELPHARSSRARGVALFVDTAGVRLPTLALQVLSAAEHAPIEQLPDGARVGSRVVHASPDGTAVVGVRGDLPEVSMWEAAQSIGNSEPPRLGPDFAAAFRDKLVLIAPTSRLLRDVGEGPSGGLVPLVALHVSLLSDLLEGRSLREVPRGAMDLATLLLAGLLVAVALLLRPPVAAVSLAVVLLGILGGSLMAVKSGWVPLPLEPALAAALAFLSALGARLVTQERDRALLQDAFGAYVDPAVVERVLADPERYLALGGARRELSVLFSDIQGYTGLSNALPPAQVMELLREYLDVMTRLVRAHGGRVDKIMGDGIMAVFGDPVPDANHPRSAVSAALAMQREMVRLTDRWREAGQATLAIRVGVATGDVFVGNIGAPGAKIEYTVLGPTVNLAARLESKAPAGGVLVSEATRAACGEGFAFERVQGLVLKGFEGEQVAHLARAAQPSLKQSAG